MKYYTTFLFLFLSLNLIAQKNKNSLKLSFTNSESGFLFERSFGYDFRYERNTFGISNLNIGYGQSEALDITKEARYTYFVIGGNVLHDTFPLEQKENFNYFDINGSFDVLPNRKKIRLKLGTGIGFLTNRFFYLKTLDFENGNLSELEYGRHKVNALFTKIFVEGEYNLTDNLAFQVKFMRRRTRTPIADFEWITFHRSRPRAGVRSYKKDRLSLDLGLGLYF
jgi:hypothetical protein